MRLFDMIRAGGISFQDRTPVIVADAIWTAIDRTPDRLWTAADFPNVAPPFERFFIEAHSEEMPDLYGGIYFRDATNEAKKHRNEPRGAKTFDNVRWTLRITGFGAFKGWVCGFPGFAYLHVGPNGEWLDDSQQVSIYVDNQFQDHINDVEFLARHGALTIPDFMNYIPFCLQAISLMHCRNVTTEIEHPQESRQRRRYYERKNGMPMTDYHVLKIKPMRAKSAGESTAREAEGITRQHIARGHFKTYTETAPLFGKWTGTYWWESQLRGNPERGAANKDYEVLPEPE